jgi:hypothetical protein
MCSLTSTATGVIVRVREISKSRVGRTCVIRWAKGERNVSDDPDSRHIDASRGNGIEKIGRL